MLRAQRVREQPLQRYPVHTEKRRAERIPVPLAIPGGSDRTPVAAVAMNEPRGLGRNLRQTLAQAQTLQHAGGVGREGDGRADLTQFGRLLEDLSDDAPLAQQQGEGNSADTGPDDHYAI